MSNESLTGVHYPHPFDELLVEMCETAARQICILSPQLDHEVFDSEALVETLGVLVRSSRQTRVRILIRESRSLVARGHRLLLLARRLSTAVQIHKLTDHPDWKGQTVVIRDHDGVLYKPGDSDHEGFYFPDSRASTRPYLEQFDELWRHSAQDIELRTLSL